MISSSIKYRIKNLLRNSSFIGINKHDINRKRYCFSAYGGEVGLLNATKADYYMHLDPVWLSFDMDIRGVLLIEYPGWIS